MKSSAVILAFVACFVFSSASAGSVLDNEEAQGEARTIFSSGGTYYLALNTTYLIYYGVLIGLGALAIVALAQSGSGSSSAAQSYGSQNNYGYSLRADEFAGDAYEEVRQKRSAFNNGKQYNNIL